MFILLQRDQEIGKVVIVPKIAHGADSFGDSAHDFFMGELPFTAYRQERRLGANLKMMHPELTRGEERVLNFLPPTAVSLARTCSEARRENPVVRDLLPIEVDRYRHRVFELGMNQGIVTIDFDILRQHDTVELQWMVKAACPILHHVIRQNYRTVWAIADGAAVNDRALGNRAEIDYPVEGLARPLGRRLDLLGSLRTTFKLERNMQHRLGWCHGRIESVGEQPARCVRGKTALSETNRKGGRDQGDQPNRITEQRNNR